MGLMDWLERTTRPTLYEGDESDDGGVFHERRGSWLIDGRHTETDHDDDGPSFTFGRL